MHRAHRDRLEEQLALRQSVGRSVGQTFFGIFFHVDRNLADSEGRAIHCARSPERAILCRGPEAILAAHLVPHPSNQKRHISESLDSGNQSVKGGSKGFTPEM